MKSKKLDLIEVEIIQHETTGRILLDDLNPTLCIISQVNIEVVLCSDLTKVIRLAQRERTSLLNRDYEELAIIDGDNACLTSLEAKFIDEYSASLFRGNTFKYANEVLDSN